MSSVTVTGCVFRVAIIASSLVAGCGPKLKPASKAIEVGVDDAVPRFDAYLTWSDYTGTPQPERPEIYIWNGQRLGRGREGFGRVIAKLNDLKVGSTVLIYPDYFAIGNYDLRGPSREPPWWLDSDDRDGLSAAAEARGLTYVYSVRDHRGELTPLAKEVYEDYQAYLESGSRSARAVGASTAPAASQATTSCPNR